MRRSQPHSIGEGIGTVLEDLGLGRKLREHAVLDLWPSVAGAPIAAVTTAERVRDGRLIVRVSRAPWRNELLFLKRELIERINAAMGSDVIRDIVFK